MSSNVAGPELSGPKIVHRVKSRLGYTEMHANAPGFGGEDLVVAEENQKNWKGMTIAFLVIVVILASVAVSVFLLTPPEAETGAIGLPFDLTDILDDRFIPRRFNGSWISESELVIADPSGGLSIVDVFTMNATQILNAGIAKRFAGATFTVSPDRRFALVKHNVKKRYRYSTFAQYTTYDLSSGVSWDVSMENMRSNFINYNSRHDVEVERLLFARWMPSEGLVEQGSGSALVFVQNFSVFLVPDVSRRVKELYPLSTTTASTRPDSVFHGVPDWIYEEDVLKRGDALWPSPDGKFLIFATFDDSDVEKVTWQVYGKAQADDSVASNAYPKVQSMHYPRAGSQNPRVTLWLVDLRDLSDIQTVVLKAPISFKGVDHYLTGVSWAASSDVVAVNWMRRAQDVAVVALCRHPHWTCSEAFRESSPGWSTLFSPVLLNADGSAFLVQTPIRDGDHGYFKQIALVNVEPVVLTHPLSMGHTIVDDILGWDEDNDLIYFLGITEDLPWERHLFTLSSDWSADDTLECLSCQLKPMQLWGRKCLFNSAKMNPSLTYFVLECLGPDLPATFLVGTAGNYSAENVTSLDLNSDLQDILANYSMPVLVKSRILVDNGTADARLVRTKLHLPPTSSNSTNRKYPLVLHVYSGPGHQLVTDAWKIDFTTYLSTKLNYVVLEVDGAGSGGQSHDSLTKVKGHLGQLEARDQLAALQHIVNTSWGQIDASRMGVTGVSYGGFMAIRILSDETDVSDADNVADGKHDDIVKAVVRCGVAVSPVVDWRHYESAYSERYLGIPNRSDTLNSYERSSVFGKVKYLRGKRLLLAHGTADKNVHLHHSMLLAKELVENDILFQQQIYPDEGHFMEGVKMHLFSSVSKFLQRCFS